MDSANTTTVTAEFLELPAHLQLHIMLQCRNVHDVCRLGQTCRALWELAGSHELWPKSKPENVVRQAVRHCLSQVLHLPRQVFQFLPDADASTKFRISITMHNLCPILVADAETLSMQVASSLQELANHVPTYMRTNPIAQPLPPQAIIASCRADRGCVRIQLCPSVTLAWTLLWAATLGWPPDLSEAARTFEFTLTAPPKRPLSPCAVQRQQMPLPADGLPPTKLAECNTWEALEPRLLNLSLQFPLHRCSVPLLAYPEAVEAMTRRWLWVEQSFSVTQPAVASGASGRHTENATADVTYGTEATVTATTESLLQDIRRRLAVQQRPAAHGFLLLHQQVLTLLQAVEQQCHTMTGLTVTGREDTAFTSRGAQQASVQSHESVKPTPRSLTKHTAADAEAQHSAAQHSTLGRMGPAQHSWSLDPATMAAACAVATDASVAECLFLQSMHPAHLLPDNLMGATPTTVLEQLLRALSCSQWQQPSTSSKRSYELFEHVQKLHTLAEGSPVALGLEEAMTLEEAISATVLALADRDERTAVHIATALLQCNVTPMPASFHTCTSSGTSSSASACASCSAGGAAGALCTHELAHSGTVEGAVQDQTGSPHGHAHLSLEKLHMQRTLLHFLFVHMHLQLLTWALWLLAAL